MQKVAKEMRGVRHHGVERCRRSPGRREVQKVIVEMRGVEVTVEMRGSPVMT